MKRFSACLGEDVVFRSSVAICILFVAGWPFWTLGLKEQFSLV